MSARNWILRGKFINELVQQSLAKQVAMASSVSMTDIEIRVNGEWLRFEADWVKYLQPLVFDSAMMKAAGEAFTQAVKRNETMQQAMRAALEAALNPPDTPVQAIAMSAETGRAL